MTDELERRVDALETACALQSQSSQDIKDHLTKQDKLLWFIFSTLMAGLVTYIIFH